MAFGSSICNSRSLASAEPPETCCAEALVLDISDAAARPAANMVRRSIVSMAPCSFLKFCSTIQPNLSRTISCRTHSQLQKRDALVPLQSIDSHEPPFGKALLHTSWLQNRPISLAPF